MNPRADSQDVAAPSRSKQTLARNVRPKSVRMSLHVVAPDRSDGRDCLVSMCIASQENMKDGVNPYFERVLGGHIFGANLTQPRFSIVSDISEVGIEMAMVERNFGCV